MKLLEVFLTADYADIADSIFISAIRVIRGSEI